MLPLMIISLAVVPVLTSGPIIEIGDGKLMGEFKHSVSGKLHSAFLGIPFAQPPVRSTTLSS